MKCVHVYILVCVCVCVCIYKIIHKSPWDFRPLRYSSRYRHAEGEHANRGRDTPNFCPTLQVLDISTLGDAADVNPVIKFLPHTLPVCGRNLITGLASKSCHQLPAAQVALCGRNLITGLTSAASPKVDISRTCKVEQKLGVSLPLLACSPSA